jgi:hypothetical protein
MDIEEYVEQLLATLGKKLGLGELSFNEEGSCLFVLDENKLFIIDLDESTRTLIISVALGMLPEENREEVLYDLLTANYYWMRTGGGTLGVDPENNVVLLCYLMQLPLENDMDFLFCIEKLANVADYWVERLKNIKEISSSELPPDQFSMMKV